MQSFFRAVRAELDYLSKTFHWIWQNLKSWRGAKLVAKTLWFHFVAVFVSVWDGAEWFWRNLMNPRRRWKLIKETILVVIIGFFIFTGGTILWAAFLQIPDLNSFEPHLISQSTQIYDRTGKILLYDLGHEIRRTVVPFDQISPNIKNATVAIEDADFYKHKGIRFTSILRAVWVNVTHVGLNQGGSTITQQVIKNSLLTGKKSIPRKIKEWILALKLEKQADKDTILNLYLNLVPYGGNIYGIEEASQAFYAKSASELDLAEAAYLAALTQAPSYYSPFGRHRDALEDRKNLVLQKMLENNFINQEQLDQAQNEKVAFISQGANTIKAPHFVMFIKQYLEEKYGADVVSDEGLRVITSLDYNMQAKAEETVKKYVTDHQKEFKAENGALVAVDPKTGQILAMVGSRDYFDPTIDGNFNVATAHRQPGSSFKPFVYSTAFDKGYTPDTVIFDLPTEFSVNCTADGTPKFGGANCYHPSNFEGGFNGPVTFRNALAQSRNIPGVKVLYLAGVKDSIETGHAMGIQSLNRPPEEYGLTLVLGGGEVSPLDMAEAYSVFANNGARNPETGILSVTDRDGKVLEEFATSTIQVIPEQSALLVNDILSDNVARAPLFGGNYFPGYKVAMKTGTSNDYRDVWTDAYTPDIAVSTWMGNNDNSPMNHYASARVVAPMLKQFMMSILPDLPNTGFKAPAPIDPTGLKPVLRGVWQGGTAYSVDKTSGQIATDLTPPELKEDVYNYNVHEILYWVNKDDPRGPPPSNPADDPQFEHWEIPVQNWAAEQGYGGGLSSSTIPTGFDDTHTNEAAPKISISSPNSNVVYRRDDLLPISIRQDGKYSLSKVDFFINGAYLGSADKAPFNFSFVPNDIAGIRPTNELRVVAYDTVLNRGEASILFRVSNN